MNFVTYFEEHDCYDETVLELIFLYYNSEWCERNGFVCMCIYINSFSENIKIICYKSLKYQQMLKGKWLLHDMINIGTCFRSYIINKIIFYDLY